MKRSFAALVVAVMLAVIPAAGIVQQTAASRPTAQNTRNFHFTQSYPNGTLVIVGEVSAEPKISCNSRIAFLFNPAPGIYVTAKCHVVGKQTESYPFTMSVSMTVSGETTVKPTKCDAEGESDAETGKIQLKCRITGFL